MAIGASAADDSALSLLANVGPDPDFGGDPAGMTAAFDLTADPAPTTARLTNGQAEGDLIGPDGCLYMADQDTVYRVTNADGTCEPLGARNENPTLTLTPTMVTPDPEQGDPRTFTARLHYATRTADVPINLVVSGANSLVKQAWTDTNGEADFSYAGVFTGTDTVKALATVGGATFTSNTAQVAWLAGRHTPLITLNPSPRGAAAGEMVTVVASLTDISENPPIAVEGATIQFSLDGGSCMGVTDADGLASCELAPMDAETFSLEAGFDGSVEYVEAMDSTGFNVMMPSSGPDCSGAEPTPSTIWPPRRRKFVPVQATGVTDAHGNALPITITAIQQDEVLTGKGTGRKCPDAKGIGESTAYLRAERSRTGNGRIYHLSFSATDGMGASCEGSVEVCVPRYRYQRHKVDEEDARLLTPKCIDQGPLFDSTGPCEPLLGIH